MVRDGKMETTSVSRKPRANDRLFPKILHAKLGDFFVDLAMPRKRPGQRRVRLVGGLTVMESPGGGEIQMRCLEKSLQETDIDARCWRPWEESLSDVDLLHLFGTHREFLPLVGAAQRQGVRLVLSPIAWYDLGGYLRSVSGWHHRILAGARYLVRAHVPGIPSWRRRLYHAADLLLPNSRAEAHQLMRHFGVPASQIHCVPNGADPNMSQATARPFFEKFGVIRFVLLAGRIEPRKNQLAVLRAMQDQDVPIVVLGDPVPGHEDYYEACRRAGGEHTRFVPRMDHDDPMLASAYAACGCLVLPSWFETPGLVALEAGLSGAPLVLTDRGAAPEYFGPLATYVAPNDLRGIRHAIMRNVRAPRSRELADLIRFQFSWSTVASLTRDAYRRVLDPDDGDPRPTTPTDADAPAGPNLLDEMT